MIYRRASSLSGMSDEVYGWKLSFLLQHASFSMDFGNRFQESRNQAIIQVFSRHQASCNSHELGVAGRNIALQVQHSFGKSYGS